MITLLLGGTRSGKSELAERFAATLPPPVTYVATADAGDDADFAERIAEHRRRRRKDWATLEPGPDLCGALRALKGTAVVDSLGTWVAAIPAFAADREELCAALRSRDGSTVVVSDEVGLGVHPSTETGRRFRDELGKVNQAVAEVADEVLLVVAGRMLRLQPPALVAPEARRREGIW